MVLGVLMDQFAAKGAIVDQIAALPVRLNKKGKLRVLMVTSRENRRWVMPKGWEMDGKKPWRAAEIEALEEAGAVGYIAKKSVGTYRYRKRLDKRGAIECLVTLYPMIVERLEPRWKERNERTRRWFSLKNAAKLVDEPELSALLVDLHNAPVDRLPFRKLFEAGKG